ncbi:MAG: RdgB/HAM1 family non-canonical purine NTP pyrophosphatase [Spirochaetales bacterium]|nr:RdgB/HAM1 family non-canonical purine NTP pyrophosphatase [Spirochaetales bacterium]
MEIVLATGNLHKKEELAEILNGHRILLPSDLGCAFDCIEDGETYLDNALIKARALYKVTGRPVIADDSGISVPALGGAPGVYSARYGSEEAGRMLESPERNDFLLKKMEHITDRKAFFVCSMVLMLDEYRIYTVQETFTGEIAREPFGGGGFGYDPLFYLKEYGKTVAQLPSQVKNRISHRGKAGAAIKEIMDSLDSKK